MEWLRSFTRGPGALVNGLLVAGMLLPLVGDEGGALWQLGILIQAAGLGAASWWLWNGQAGGAERTVWRRVLAFAAAVLAGAAVAMVAARWG